MYKPKNELLIPTHRFLVRACETERGLPKVFNLTMKTLWPDTEAERHIDYTPERTHVTYCKPTESQIDDHARALQMVAAALDDVIDRRITWAVAQSAAFRDRGPKWEKVSLMLKGMGQGYPKSVYLLKHRYEESLLSILSQQVSKNWHKNDADLFCELRRFDI
jgi:hypothetical protein